MRLQDLPARFGGFLHEAFAFDAAACSIAATEAVLMDPQQRLLLESVAEALHGSVPAASATARSVAVGQQGAVGVFIGISTPDYADLAKAYSTISPYSSTGAVLGFELLGLSASERVLHPSGCSIRSYCQDLKQCIFVFLKPSL